MSKNIDTCHYHGHRQRLRERLQKNASGLADYELLELLLAQSLPRKDTKPLAKELLQRFGSLRAVLYAPFAQLAECKGIGTATLVAWELFRELWARIQEEKLYCSEELSDPLAIVDAARARFGSKSREELWAVFLDTRNRVIAWECVVKGTTDHALLTARDIMTPALAHQAPKLVLVHNHPGGAAWPSEEDKLFTLQIVQTGAGIGVMVLDHIIITELEYYSFQEHNLL